MRKLPVMAATLLGLSTLAVTGSPAGGSRPARSTATAVRVVHAIPGTALSAPEALPVDIAVDGVCALTGVEFGAVAEVELTGPVDIDISLADLATPCSNASVIDVDGLALPAGEQVSLVAHLDGAGHADGVGVLRRPLGHRRARRGRARRAPHRRSPDRRGLARWCRLRCADRPDHLQR